jgi:hypothetical protein
MGANQSGTLPGMRLAAAAWVDGRRKGEPVGTDRRADIEHQLRTQLTTISLAGQLLRRDGLAGERQQRLSDLIIRACTRLLGCLDEMFGQDRRVPPAS